MKTIEFLGVHLDICPTTGGIWFDEGEFGRIRKATEKLPELEDLASPAFEAVPDRVHRQCPNCSTALYSYRFLYSSPVTLDGCGTCNGIWVDEGELEAMADALIASKVKPKLSEEAALALAEMQMARDATERRVRAIVGFFKLAAFPRFWQL